ncbi:MAG: Uma2 family endonuclease [Deltaproteobacteria bacterium]|nr:Uma2 family endonuclease [Deltaproteobacteria bacterium]
MASRAPTVFTEVEYLALEAASETKHEFLDGAIVAMAGASPAHNALAANVTVALGRLTRGKGCITLTSDQRIHVPPTGLYTYADVLVACGERRYKAGRPASLLNPTIIVEVTSETTEDYDRGKKLINYQSIPELRDYVLVSHRERRIDHYRRGDHGEWIVATHTAPDARVLMSGLGEAFTVNDIYEGVDLAEGETSDQE